MLKKEVQGLQDMTISRIAIWSLDLRKNQISRWFPPTESFPKSVSVFSVVCRLINRTILFRCLQISHNILVPLFPEPLALDLVHVLYSQVEEPLQEKCVIETEPVALVQSIGLAPLKPPVLVWIQ